VIKQLTMSIVSKFVGAKSRQMKVGSPLKPIVSRVVAKKVTLGTSHCVKCSNVFLYCVNMKILYVHLLANALLMLSYKTFVFVMGQITC